MKQVLLTTICAEIIHIHAFSTSGGGHLATENRGPGGGGGCLYGIKGFRSVGVLVMRASLAHCSNSFSALTRIIETIQFFDGAFPSAVTRIDHDDREPEVFDHVLIDANQFLHSNLRKAFNKQAKQSMTSTLQNGRALGELDENLIQHSLHLFIREIDNLVWKVAVPRRSIVIAVDGAPPAAKLDMQRRRRYGTYEKVETQRRQMEVLKERGWTDEDFRNNGSSTFKRTRYRDNPILLKHERDLTTLNITPGTAYMERVTQALLFWAWKYVNRVPFVRVYVSPSSVHGEGEIKLLDWMFHGQHTSGRRHVMEDDTVAILGGDSDLVLMALAVPPSVTKNIFTLLPGERSTSLVVSVWETTRQIVGMIEGTSRYGGSINGQTKFKQRIRSLTEKEVYQARMDAVMLIILNGNDYLVSAATMTSSFPRECVLTHGYSTSCEAFVTSTFSSMCI